LRVFCQSGLGEGKGPYTSIGAARRWLDAKTSGIFLTDAPNLMNEKALAWYIS